MTLDQHWYALRVHARSEPAVLTSLTYYGFESYWPHTTTRRKYADRVKSVESAIIPGYIFCKFAVREKSKVLSSHGVNGIVSLGGQPNPIPAHEIEAVRRTVEAGGGPAREPLAGSRVRVVRGCLTGLEGLLVRAANQSHFLVSIDILQRSVSVSIERDLVEAISNL